MDCNEQIALAKMEQGRTPHWFKKIEKKIVDIVISELSKRSSNTKVESIPTSLEEYKRYAKKYIDDKSSRVRSEFTTPILGQDALYAEKSEESVDYISSGYPADLLNYPLINAEVNATGKTPKDVVNGILKKKTEWLSFNANIEEIRLRGKMLIDSKDTKSINEVKDIILQTENLLIKVL